MKKKGYIILSIISMIIIITLGASLAFSGGTVILGEKKTSVKVGDLTFRYVEKNRKINLEDTEPISDASGKALNNYFEFDIEANLVGSDLIYEVDIESLEGTTINPEGIKIYLTEVVNNSEVELNSNYDGNGKVKTISNYSNGILYQERVLKNTKNYKKTYRVRMWIDEEIDWSDDGYIGEKGLYIINVNARSNVNMIDTSVPVPEITGGNNSWTTSTSTIRVLSTNPVVGGIEKYEYYITQDEDDVPNDITIVTGETTTGEIVVNRVGKNYVYYRLVTSGGERGNWSSRQVVYYDNTEYSITYNLNGGTQGENAVNSYTVETNTFNLPTPTKTGYTFSGWYENSNFTGNAVTQIEKPSRGNKEYYAKWTANTYTVTLDKQSGSGGTASVTGTYGSAIPSITKPTKTGYTFGGYYTETGGKGTQYIKADGTSARNWDKTSATTLYANWTANTYTVTLDKQSGSGGTGSVTATYGSAMPSGKTAPTRPCYTFAGYYDATSGGTQYYNASMQSVKNWDKTSATTLYARWTANTTQYVSSSGNDSTGLGTSGSPFATIGKAYSCPGNLTIKLLSNITQTSQANFTTTNKSVTLTSNSGTYTITRGSSLTSAFMIYLSNGGTLTTTNITFDGNNVTAGRSLIDADKSSILNLNTGTTIQKGISNNEYYGGAVSGWSGATININGAVIQNNKAYRRGGALYTDGGTINVNSGQISNNSLTGSDWAQGGGLFGWNSTLNIKGGTISNNTACEGGGVWLGTSGTSGSTAMLTMTNGNIYNNSATVGNGGGIFILVDTNGVASSATFNMTGGNIYSNTTANSGGGVGVYKAKFTMSSGSIYSNTAKWGGGVGVMVNATFYFKGGSIYNNNVVADGNSGGIDVNESALYFQGGSLTNNKCTTSCGATGIWYCNGSTYSYTSGTISGNTVVNGN